MFGVFTVGLQILDPTAHAQVTNSLGQAYTIVDLGILPGGPNDSSALAINNAGQVVGQSFVSAPSYYKSFVWDAINGISDLGVLSGDNTTVAASINNNGQVVGYCGDGTYGDFQAAQWNSASGLQPLGYGALAGYPYFAALAINEGGAITYINWNYYGPPSAAYLLLGAIETPIGGLYPGAYTWPYALNNSNEVVGASYNASQTIGQAFLWTSSQGVNGLGFLPGYTNSIAKAINDAHQVVGYCNNSGGGQSSFIWTSETGMTALDCSIGSNSCANGISPDGIVVGYNQIGGTNHAVAWPPGQNAVDLNTLVTNLSGWINLTEANAMNSSGLVVGDGIRTNGVRHGFILYPTTVPLTVNIKTFAGIIISNALPGSTVVIQATSNLAATNWVTLTNVMIPSQQYIFIDYNSPFNPSRFYRVFTKQ